jgi:hypothetical protein
MKLLVTTGALVTLLAGASIANAQMTRSPDNDKANATQFNSQAADPTTGPGASRTPGGMTDGQRISGNAAFCITSSASNSSILNCKYATMAACEQEAKPMNFQCSPNPKLGTTGARQ